MATLEQRIRIAQYWAVLGDIAGWGLVAWAFFAFSAGSKWYAVLFFLACGFMPGIGIGVGFIAWWKLGWTGFTYLVLVFLLQHGFAMRKDAAYAVATGRDPDDGLG